jgi:Raf kinase inhibitor-like YbhB/YbcL family protein
LYTCDGQNISPPLSFSQVPETTKSLALIVDDPDAPAGSADPGWVHWIVYNIAAEAIAIGEDTVPVGSSQGLTDFGNTSYGGPCPPSGQHRYFFTLYALDDSLTFSSPPTKGQLIEAMRNHIVGQTRLIGLYSKS